MAPVCCVSVCGKITFEIATIIQPKGDFHGKPHASDHSNFIYWLTRHRTRLVSEPTRRPTHHHHAIDQYHFGEWMNFSFVSCELGEWWKVQNISWLRTFTTQMRMSHGADQTSPAAAAGSRKSVSKQRNVWGKCFFGHKVFMATFRYALLFFFISSHFI